MRVAPFFVRKISSPKARARARNAAARRQRLVVMVKAPRPGRVKTRLGAGIGMTAAARWFRAQTTSLLRRVEDPRWETILAVSPDAEGAACRFWPAHLPRWPQGGGDLGARLALVSVAAAMSFVTLSAFCPCHGRVICMSYCRSRRP